MQNKIAVLFIENYTYGGSEKIAELLINNLSIPKKYLFINKRSPSVSSFKNFQNENTYILQYYSLITPFELGTFAKKFIRYPVIYYTLRIFNLVLRYPLIIFSIFYFAYLFYKLKINIYISNNGGYPGGEYNRSSTLAASLLLNCSTFHIFHSLPVTYKKYTQIIEKFYDTLLDKYSIFVTDSIVSASTMKKNRCITQNINVIYNGTNWKKQKKYSSNGQLKLINIASIDHNKNQMMLLRAMDILINNLKLDLSLTLVGEINEIDYFTELEHFCLVKNLEKNVFFKGFITDPTDYYYESDIFLLSSYIESFPTVIIEAMSVGLPIITTNAGGVSEQIFHNYNGYIIPINDYQSLVEKICHFNNHRQEIKAFGIASYEIHKNKFLLNKMIAYYNDLFLHNIIKNSEVAPLCNLGK